MPSTTATILSTKLDETINWNFALVGFVAQWWRCFMLCLFIGSVHSFHIFSHLLCFIIA